MAENAYYLAAAVVRGDLDRKKAHEYASTSGARCILDLDVAVAEYETRQRALEAARQKLRRIKHRLKRGGKCLFCPMQVMHPGTDLCGSTRCGEKWAAKFGKEEP